MDLITLDDNNQPEKLVENYDSLIWTERYTIGDFQIVTGDVNRFMDLLPEGQVVSLRESSVPMIVETHLIERKKNSPTKLTIKGRDFCSICDRRVTTIDNGTGGTGDYNIMLYTPQDVAYYLMDTICGIGAVEPLDEFPSSKVTFVFADYETSTGPVRQFTIPRGNLLTTVLEFLKAEAKLDVSTTPDTPAVIPHGLRAVRPAAGATNIQIQIYHGVDRSTQVYFDATRDLLDDGSYLFSKVGSATSAIIYQPDGSLTLEKNPADIKSGFDRRVILVDGSQTQMEEVSLVENAKISLSEAQETAMFDGSINQDLNPYVYNVDYGLGDLVKLVGDYGLERTARVTEYIRSEDATGSKAYPTLVTIQE